MDYDTSAAEFAAHRRVHDGVVRTLRERGQLGPDTLVLEVGCGTGSYICALVAWSGCSAWGLDPSLGMLSRARAAPEAVAWVRGRAEQLPFAGAAFDLIFLVDVIHHLSDKAAFFLEAARCLRPGGRVCTATDSEEMIRRREILSGYFPETVPVELARYPRLSQLRAWMEAAGFSGLQTICVAQPYALTDPGPFHDRASSSLHLIPDATWRAGLKRLEQDLAQGPVHGASRYACVWGQLVCASHPG